MIRPSRHTWHGLVLALPASLLLGGCAEDETAPTAGTSDARPVTISVRPNEALLDPPAPRALARGTTLQLTAIAGFEDLTTRDVTDEVTWASTRPDVVSVEAGGRASALRPGNAAITATLGRAWNYASVTVREEPGVDP